MIWLLLIFKAILTTWFFARRFKYFGIFLATHTIFDVVNKCQNSHFIGMISFICIPHLLTGLLAETYQSRNLKYVNLFSFLLLLYSFLSHPTSLQDVINYFLHYTVVVLIALNRSVLKCYKESFPLLGALIIQTLELVAYKISYSNYAIINILNAVYYISLTVYLLCIQINTLILDDPPSSRNKFINDGIIGTIRSYKKNYSIKKAA